jgi:hypothetical protein
MKDLLRMLVIGFGACTLSMQVEAGTTKTPKSNTPEITEPSPQGESTMAENFRCEKFRDGGVSELKLKLIENCDLSKPFSNSMSLFAGEETYLYCCHKKK